MRSRRAAGSIRWEELYETKALFVSLHLDDVAISCGGNVRLQVAQGNHPVVVTVFTKTPKFGEFHALARKFHRDSGVGEQSADELWRLRKIEDRAANMILGVPPVWLERSDAVYRGNEYDALDKLFSPNLKSSENLLVEGIATELIALWKATREARVYLPLAVGNHVDHQICFAPVDGLRRAGADVWFYEDCPYAFNCAALQARLAAVGKKIHSAVDIEVSQHLDRRLLAMSCYSSQVRGLFGSLENMRRSVKNHAAVNASGSGQYVERLWH